MFITFYSKLILILATIILTLAYALNPLSKEYKYFGYSFITAILMSLFPFFLNLSNYGTELKLNALPQIISYILPVIMILMGAFKPSIKNDIHMLNIAIIINIIFVFIFNFNPKLVIYALESKIILTILFVLNLVLLYFLHRYKLKDFFKVIILFSIGNILFTIYNLKYAPVITQYIGYIAIATGYILSAITIYKDHEKLNEENLNFQNQLKEDFEDVVQREVRKQTRRVEWSKEQLKQKSEIDNLTGALLKKPLLDLMDSYIHSSNMKKFSILMFDIDNFKSLNDNFGHIIGDKCLKDLVSIAVSSIDFNDSIGRYGGDEFFIILPDQPAGQALKVANRFRENVMKKTDPPYTISIGIASYPWDGDTHKKLIAVADEGLYKSKEKGRNSASYTGLLNTSHEFNG